MGFIPDCNLGIMNGEHPKERNATMLCVEADYAFENGRLPYPFEMWYHLTQRHNAAIVRD